MKPEYVKRRTFFRSTPLPCFLFSESKKPPKYICNIIHFTQYLCSLKIPNIVFLNLCFLGASPEKSIHNSLNFIVCYVNYFGHLNWLFSLHKQIFSFHVCIEVQILGHLKFFSNIILKSMTISTIQKSWNSFNKAMILSN